MYALFYIYFIIYTLLYIKLFCGFISPRCPLLVCLPCWWWYSFCWCIFPAGVGVFPDGVGVFPDGVGVSLLVCLPCWCVFPDGVGVLPGGWWMSPGWWCQCRQHIAAGHPSRGHTRLLSAAALSRPNRSFKVKTTNKIALIISYLNFDFRMYFYRTG